MVNSAPVIVQNNDGLLGVLEHPDRLRVGSEARIAVRLTGGRVVLVPIDLMVEQADGSFHLELATTEIAQLETEAVGAKATAPTERVETVQAQDTTVVPVIAETVEVEKRRVESGRVRIQKSVATTDQVVNDSLIHDNVEVERIPINKIIEAPVGNRQEGETLVVPVLKEVLVVEKRLMLVEEIRITRRQVEQPFSQTVPLRTESVVVERVNADDRAPVGGVPRKKR